MVDGDGERHIDFFVRAVPALIGFGGRSGSAWEAYAEWPVGAGKVERCSVSDAPRATLAEAAEELRLRVEGDKDGPAPWQPRGEWHA